MTDIRGTNIGAPIVPGNEADEFPTHIDKYGGGGYRAVAVQADLAAIPLARRRPGMIVFVLEFQQPWILSDNLLVWKEHFVDGGNF